MPALFQFFFFGYGNITRLLLRLPLLMCVAPFMETAVFHVLFPDVAGNAPDSAFPKDCGIEAVVLQNLPGKLSCLVFRKKDLLKLFGKVQLKLGYAVGVAQLVACLLWEDRRPIHSLESEIPEVLGTVACGGNSPLEKLPQNRA